ncbi:pilus assembly PilX family protein [Luteimonas saliphila]|uniref:pilus assembly PilX family protein n=1 Tax=Luteimonas saliphila TaxID=2804919 RepID=UPI001EE269ED|nr:PilX N-terminal domain-containing pilus assembly protein [Luteimonas saliphila]
MKNYSSLSRARQSGAVLYVALIMLILLALIGVIAMQVAGLQERMSANYQAGNAAFQNAESVARLKEHELEEQVNAGGNPTTNLPPTDCSAFDVHGWDSAAPFVRRLDLCFSWGALDMPADEAERTDQIYQVTAYSRDRPAFPSSESVIDTVFIP